MTKPSQQCQAQRALPVLHSRSLAIHDPLPFPGDVEFALFALFGSPWRPWRVSLEGERLCRAGLGKKTRLGFGKRRFWLVELTPEGPTPVLLILAHITYKNQSETLYKFPAGATIVWIL